MHLRKLAKDADSGTNGCPAVYDLDVLPEYLAIQGEQADAEVMARLENLLPGETAVIIAASSSCGGKSTAPEKSSSST